MFEIWHKECDNKQKSNSVYDYVLTKFKLENSAKDIQVSLKQITVQFCYDLMRKWMSSHKVIGMFLLRHDRWLELNLVFPEKICRAIAVEYEKLLSAERLKRLSGDSIKLLLKAKTSQELALGTEISLQSLAEVKKQSERAQSRVQSVIAEPTEPQKSRLDTLAEVASQLRMESDEPISYTPEEAYALCVEGNLTKRQYQGIRYYAQQHNLYVYPSYRLVKAAQKRAEAKNKETEKKSGSTPI